MRTEHLPREKNISRTPFTIPAAYSQSLSSFELHPVKFFVVSVFDSFFLFFWFSATIFLTEPNLKFTCTFFLFLFLAHPLYRFLSISRVIPSKDSRPFYKITWIISTSIYSNTKTKEKKKINAAGEKKIIRLFYT